MDSEVMEKKKHDSEDSESYWDTSAHSGFNFDDGDIQVTAADSKLSTLMRKDELNHLDLLKCHGFTEVVENTSSRHSLPFPISPVANEKSALKLARDYDPLVINQKKQIGSKKSGPEETIKNIILGLDYSLTEFKGKEEKEALLSEAVRSHDGNAILAVVLFLKDTLKKKIFQREIIAYPDAVNVYLSYLEEDHEMNELTYMLSFLNRSEEAAILEYEIAIQVEDPKNKLRRLENCLRTHFQVGTIDSFLCQSVEEHRQILEEQIKVKSHVQTMDETENLGHFEKLTGRKSLIDSSVICSLIFSCLYNLYSGELSFASPEKIKSNYNLSKKQYTWAMLRAFAAAERWSNIDDLFMSKSWLGGTKMRSCIEFSRILEVLFQAKASNEILKKYVSYIENEEEKFTLAKKYACHSVAIEILKNNKDRAGLIKYMASLSPQTVDYCNVTELLQNPTIRWKN